MLRFSVLVQFVTLLKYSFADLYPDVGVASLHLELNDASHIQIVPHCSVPIVSMLN